MRAYKRTIVCLLMFLSAAAVLSQEQIRLSEREVDGTARYVGMGGAMTAVGGDPSAVKDNPAGLGVYRRMELSISLGGKWDKTRSSAGEWGSNYSKFEMPQLSWVFDFGDPYRTKGVIFNNIMLSYNRVRQFQRECTVSARNADYSLADVIATKTNGLPETSLQQDNRWDDPEVGWLSILGYDTYLINPYNDEGNNWYTNLLEGEKVNSAVNVRESGYIDEYALDWGMNISNRWFVGAGIRLTSFYLSQTATYAEQSLLTDTRLTNYSSTIMSGLGVNGAIGVIGHPLQWLRFGLSLTTPTASTLTVSNYGEMQTIVNDTAHSLATGSYTSNYSDFSLPLHTSASVAFQWKQRGLIALQYDYAHHKNLYDLHTLKLGLEVVTMSRMYINAGYVFESTFRPADGLLPCPRGYNDVRTDTHSLSTRNTQYISCGLGWRGKGSVFQVAYQYQLQNTDFAIHELSNLTTIQSQTHRLVFTLAWHSK